MAGAVGGGWTCLGWGPAEGPPCRPPGVWPRPGRFSETSLLPRDRRRGLYPRLTSDGVTHTLVAVSLCEAVF